MMITEHFSWAEAVITQQRGVSNCITDGIITSNVVRVANKLEKVRALLSVPLIISSWYRCTELNKIIGGARKSDHLTGSAVDFIAPQYGSPLEICKALAANKELIGWKQLILEHTWVHISWDPIPGTAPKLEILSLLDGGSYAVGLTDKHGKTLV